MQTPLFDGLVGRIALGEKFRDFLAEVDSLAPSDTTHTRMHHYVLIGGTGGGPVRLTVQGEEVDFQTGFHSTQHIHCTPQIALGYFFRTV
jgi:hypothetical protein